MAVTKWRSWRFRAILLAILANVVHGYDEMYTISQLSPKSAARLESQEDTVLQSSKTENLALNIEPSANYEHLYIDRDIYPRDYIEDEKDEKHYVDAAAENIRESRSINIDEIPSTNNEIDNELEIRNKRKYYDIHPTKTVDYLHSNDEVMLSSEGFGDRLDFKFPGEEKRVPYGRALPPMGPRIRPSAVQPIFATASLRGADEARQNTEIQNIITGIVKLLNGNVNVQANTQLLRPGRPMASRINNRGPPRISDVPPLPDFDKPGPPHSFIPTKTPPPYPFDRPPVHVSLPEQIVPPLAPRPVIHRPIPPWQRPRPRPPSRRPNPGLPMYKPNKPIIHQDIPDEDEGRPEEVINENDTVHLENAIHHEEPIPQHVELSTAKEPEKLPEITPEPTTEPITTTTTTEKPTTTEKITTTEKPKTEKPVKLEKEKKKEPLDKEKQKHKIEDKIQTKDNTTVTKISEIKPEIENEIFRNITTTETPKNEISEDKTKLPEDETKFSEEKTEITENKTEISENKTEISEEKTKIPENKAEFTEAQKNSEAIKSETAIELQPSVSDTVPVTSSLSPTPTEGLMSTSSTIESTSRIETSSIKTQPLESSSVPYKPYRPRPGIVLDDTDFKPHGNRYSRPEAPVITAPIERPQGYGEIFDVTVSAIQGPGDKGASVHIETVNLNHEHDDIIVSPSGEQGFVSIDGKRTYLNLFDTTTTSVRPTRVQQVVQQSVPPLPPPPLAHGQGVAIPTDDVPPVPPVSPVRRPHPTHPVRNRPHGYRPQPTVRIDTCIVGDDSSCDKAQNEKCRTEAGISSCQCRPGFGRRTHRDPCRRVISLLLNMRVDRIYDRKVAWDAKLGDKDSEPYQQLNYEAIRAIDSAFSMTPFSDDFVGGVVNTVHRGDENNSGVYVNYTILLQETPESIRPSIATDIQKHMLGVIRRRSNNIGASALWVDSVAGSVLPLHDLDECSSPDLNDCHQLATCLNTWGAFKCICPDSTLDSGSIPGRQCKSCPASQCSDRGTCRYTNTQPYCTCSSGYYGSRCEVDGEVVGVALGASLAAALVIGATLAALLSWSRKWSREQKAIGMGSPVFNYMASNTVKTPPVGQPPYQVTMEERLRWAQIAEAMVQANHYASETQTMATRPSSAMFGGYPTLPHPPVPLPRMGLHGHHNGTLNTVTSRGNNPPHHSLYGYTNQMAAESTSSEASSHVQDRADLLVPRPKSRARSMHNQTGIYYDVDYENAEPIYGAKGIPLSTYTVSRGPPFYRT